MSEHSIHPKYCPTSSDQQESTNGCRDYMRSVCILRNGCKYRRPNSEEIRDFKRNGVMFCHDFQNTGCKRSNCKFLHCTREEEQQYKQTGQLPLRLQQNNNGVIPTSGVIKTLRGDIPICKDFLKGTCERDNLCKFRHTISPKLETEVIKPVQVSRSPFYDSLANINKINGAEFNKTGIKRRRSVPDDAFNGTYNLSDRFLLNHTFGVLFLEKENILLRRKVEELKKQVADLTATNEVLLEQNARYRVSRTNAVHTMHGGVPVSQGLTPGINAATAQAQSLVTSIAKQLALNSELTSQQMLQQRLARQLGQAPGSLPGQTINTSLTMNPASIVPASGQNVSLAPVSMQQNLPPTASLNQSIPQNLQAPPSTPLVSYPIVSQNMRAAQHSMANWHSMAQ